MKTWTNVALATTLMIDSGLGVKLIQPNSAAKNQILNTIEANGDCVDYNGERLSETECVEFLLKDILRDKKAQENSSEEEIENGGSDAGSMTAGELSDGEESEDSDE